MTAPIIVWFRNDLRLADQPALSAAAAEGPVIPLFLWPDAEAGDWAPGAAVRLWLHHSLEALAGALEARGSRLLCLRGPALDTLRALVRQSGARGVYWNRRYEPAGMESDRQIKQSLRADGLQVRSFPGNLLHEPFEVATGAGTPFKVYTPFWRHYQARQRPAAPLPEPPALPAPATWPSALAPAALALRPERDWDAGILACWRMGEAAARQGLAHFLEAAVDDYPDQRDLPARPGISRLSPHLHFGELSPRHVWQAVNERERGEGRASPGEGAEGYLRQLVWRDFAHHLLYHFPHTADRPLRPEFERFPWADGQSGAAELFAAWRRGRTGYPFVDAGMRELWTTGWMHNRVRMVVASFLVKHLLLPWQWGARWFWDTLVDADLANNTLGWQWSAGCGADAAPYFRIFNPVTQGERFDGGGQYVRRWVPELAGLPDKWLHQPWKAPGLVLQAAGVRLGEQYPQPLVDHAAARARALEAFGCLRKG